jgi:glutathione-regulated potassium-efflux system ancillary protein KefG
MQWIQKINLWTLHFLLICYKASLLIQFAHSNLEQSRVPKKMLQSLKTKDGITINELYEHYLDFDIDIRREQQLLLQHDIVVLQHPLYWYSTPAIIKQWFGMVLELGMGLALSSTAIALQALQKKNLMKTAAGKSSFSALLFQDIAVIPMLVLFPLLATLQPGAADEHWGSYPGR